MRTHQMPLIEEVPLIVVGLAAAAVGAVVYGAVLGTARAVLSVTDAAHRGPATP